MKNKLWVITVVFSLFALRAHAQNGFEQLIQSGPADAGKLVEAYGRPLLKGFGLGMNSGWTNTAQTLGFLHFDIRVSGTAVIVPKSQQFFDVTKIGLSGNVGPANVNDVIASTFSGNTKADGPYMNVYNAGGTKITSFQMPRGILANYVPTPQVQLTVGLLPNTDVTVRTIPKITLGDFGAVSLIGGGIKHDILKDFSGAAKKAPFDLAVAFSYNRVNYNKDLILQPLSGSAPVDNQQSSDFSGQKIYGHFDNYLLEGIVSKQLSFFTPYVAVGYNTSKSVVGLKGNFPVPTDIRNNQIVYTTYTDPVTLNNTLVKGWRADFGFQLKFPLLRIYAAYGVAEGYGMVNAGVGIGI